MKIVIICLVLHFISGICLCIYFDKTGEWRRAVRYGDGLRSPSPADLMFTCIFMNEIYWLVVLFTWIENSINRYLKKRYK